MPTIEILVSPTGQSQVQTRGFTGVTCRTASQFLEKALGHASHEQLTAEFHEAHALTKTTALEGA